MIPRNNLRIRFILKKGRAKNNYAPLYARISYNGKYADISLKKRIDLDKWEGSQPKGNDEEVREANNHLDQIRADIKSRYHELRAQKKEITAQAVRDLFSGVDPNERTLEELIDYHNSRLKHTMRWGTMKNYFTTQKHLASFIKKYYQTSDFPLSRLSYTFLVEFEIFLLNYRSKGHGRPCTHNTALKHIERLRKMINIAIKHEWIEKDPFAKFQARFIRKDRQFLNEEEVDAIEQREFKIPHLARARDLFVFSIYTGMTYADVMSLTTDNISRGKDGEYWIDTVRQKTRRSVRFPLLPKAWEVVLKYQTDPKAQACGTVFVQISNQNLNLYLKEIGNLCGIRKHLTFHLARHTFATTIALSNGVPIETVSKVLGHASIRTTQIYAKVVDKKISQDMTALRIKLAQETSSVGRNGPEENPDHESTSKRN